MFRFRVSTFRKRSSFLLIALIVAETVLPGFAFAAPPAFSATQTVANAAEIQAVETVQVPRTLVPGDTVSLTISGTTVTQSYQIGHNATMSALASIASGIPNVSASFDQANNRLVFNLSMPNPVPVRLKIDRSGINPSTSVANVVAVAQVARIDVPQTIIPGDVLSITVDGTGLTVPYASSDTGSIAALASSIDALPQVSAVADTVARTVTVTASIAGTAFTLSNLSVVSADVSATPVVANVVPVAQVETFAIPRPLYSGESVSLTVSGTTVTQAFTGDTTTTMSAFASTLDQLSEVSASYAASTLTLTSDAPGVPFAFSALSVTGSALPGLNVTANNVAVAQKDAVVFPRQTVAGDTVRFTLNGTELSQGFTGSHAATMSGLIVQIGAMGTVSGSFDSLLNVLTVESTVPGTPFTISGAFVSTAVNAANSTPNVVPVAQVSSLTFGRDFVAGDRISLVVNGNTITSTYSGSHAATMEDLRSKIDSQANVSALASAVTRVVTVTSEAAGTSFTISSASLENSTTPTVLQNSVVAVKQTSRFSVAPTLFAGDTLSVTVGTGTVSQAFVTDDATTTANFVASLDALSGVQASWNNSSRTVTLESETAGTSFTVGNLSVSSSDVPRSVSLSAVSETRARATVTVAAVPGSVETLTIGDCAVTFTPTNALDASDTDCSDASADLGISGVATTQSLAFLLRGISGYSYDGGTALSVSGSGSDAVFTRASAQSGTTQVSTLVSSANFSTVSNTPVVAVAESASVTYPRQVTSGDTVGVTIDSVRYSQNIGSDAATDFANFVSNVSALAGFDATGDFTGSTVTVTSASAGTSFALTGTLSHAAASQTVVSAVAAVTQKTAFTLPSLPVSGDSLSVTIGGTGVSQTFSTDASTTLSNWISSMNALGSVTATLSGSQTVVLESATPGASFAVSDVTVANSVLPATDVWNVAAVAQVDMLAVPYAPISGDTLSVTVGTGSVTRSFVTDADTTLSLLNSSIDSLGTVESSVDLGTRTFTLRAKTAGTAFTASFASTGASFTGSNVTANEVNVAQVDVLSVSRVFAAGDTVSVNVAGSGIQIPFSTDSDTTATAVKDWIDSLPEVTASLAGSAGSYVFTVTSATPGTPFATPSLAVLTSIASVNAQPNVPAVAQVTSVTVPRNLVPGDSLAVTLSGASAVSVAYSGSEQATVAALAAGLDALSEVSATASGLTVTVTAAVPGVPFTLLPLSLSGSVPTTVTTANVAPVSQVDVASFPNLFPGDTVSVTLDGRSVSVPYSGSEAATLTAFASALAASGTVSASFAGTGLTVTASVPGTPFSLGTVGISNVTDALVNVAYSAPVAQVVAFDASGVAEGWTYRATLNGKNYDYLTGSGDTDSTVESALAAQILADTGAVTVSTGATDFTLTAAVPGTPFTYAASVMDITAPVVTLPTNVPETLKSGDTSTSTVASNEDSSVYAALSGTVVSVLSDLTSAVSAGNAFVVNGSASKDVAYAVSVPVGVNDGTYDFYAVDAYGNVSNAALGWLSVDNTPPLLVVSTPSGQTVHAVSMTVTGVTEASTVLTVTGSASLTGASDASGNFSLSLPLVADSANAFTVSVSDAVGNVTTRSFSVTEDGIGPAIVANFSGTSYASGASLSLTGQTEPNLAVVVTEAFSGTVASVTADGSGYYAATLPLRLDSQNDFAVTATDAAGNTGSVSFSSIQDNVDPVVVLAALPAVVDADSVVVSGTTDSNVAVTVSDGAVSTGTVSDGSGAFSVSMSLTQNATNVFTATATDASGRSGAASGTVVEDSVANFLSITTSPATVNAASIPVLGTTKPNASVSVTGGASTLTGTATSTGAWSFDVSLTQDATNVLFVSSSDALGNVSTGSLAIVEDSVFPTVTLSTASHTTYATTVPVSGTTEAFATVAVTGGSGSVTVVADAAGNFTANADLVSATANVLTVTATDAAGNFGTGSVTVTHDPVVVFLTLGQTGSSVQSGTGFTLSGTTKPNVSVTVSGGASTLTGTSDGSGAFSFSVPLVTNAANVLTVTAVDATLTQATGSVTVTNDSIAPTVSFVALPAVTSAATLTVTGTTEAFASVSALDLSGTTFTGSADAAGNFALSLPLIADSANSFAFTATDAAGNFGTGSVSVLRDSSAPNVSAVSISSSALGSTAVATYSFTTSESSTGTISFGTGSNVSATTVATLQTFGLSHTGTVPGLAQSTTYYALVSAVDAAGNVTQSPVTSFTTVATPVVPPSSGGGGGGGGGGGSLFARGGLAFDSCPNGDFSSSYYDGSCGTPPKIVVSTGTVSPTAVVPFSGTGISSTGTTQAVPTKIPVKTPMKPSEPSLDATISPNAPETPMTSRNETPSTVSNATPPSTNNGVGTLTPSVSQPTPPASRRNDASRAMVDVSEIPGFVRDKYVNVQGTAIVRSGPNFASPTVSYLPRNYPITVLAYGPNWSKVSFDGYVGYVRSVFLRDKTARDENRTDPELFTRVLTEERMVDHRNIRVRHSLFVRERPDLNSKIKTWIYSGDDVFILDQVGEWSEIRTKSGIGYVKTKYLQK